MKSSSDRCAIGTPITDNMYLSPTFQGILKALGRLFGAQLCLIFSTVTENGTKVQFVLFAADTT